MKLTITKQFQSFLQSIGADIEVLLQKAGVPNKLWQEEVTLTELEYYNLLQEFDKILSEEAIIQLSDINNTTMFIPPFFAALSSGNGLEAIERFSKFKKIVGPIEVDVVVTERTVAVKYSFVYQQQQLPKFSVLNEQLLLLSLIRTGTGENIVPLLVESPYEYGENVTSLLGVTPQQSTYNQIVFDRKDLEKIFITQNNLMWSYLEPELNKNLVIATSEKSFVNYVQQELVKAIPSGEFTLDDIANKLGVSTRTLQQNLSAENTTFSEQVQAIQKSMTFSYFKMKLSTDEISYLVGYTEVNAFQRAFKKWTGMTITQYRKENNL